jgi:RNA polymerase sigma-70 factor (ECF subfamily)
MAVQHVVHILFDTAERKKLRRVPGRPGADAMSGPATTDASEDRRLVRAVLSGSRRDFEELVRRHERLVRHIVMPMAGSAEDGEDLLQDVFMKVYSHLGAFRFESKLSTWIGNIAHNAAAHHRARRLRERRGGRGDPDGAAGRLSAGSGGPDVESAADEAASPVETLVRAEERRRLREAVRRLPGIERSILLLFHQDEQTLEEIGTMLGLPVNTVKSHLFRARRKLKDLLI